MKTIVKIIYASLLLCAFSLKSHGQCSPDTTPPTIVCPANVTAACIHEVPTLIPTTSDNCGTIVAQSYTLSGATTAASPLTGINDASSENFLAGTTTVTYTVTDESNNVNTCSFTVTITDFSAPTVICPNDVTYTNDPGECFAVVNNFPGNPKQVGVPSVFDNCTGLFTQPINVPTNTEFPVGTTTITWVIMDAAGNTVTCDQNITITDDEAPSITCPSDITINTDPGECFATVSLTPAIAIDNCTIVSSSNDHNAGGLDASGQYPLGDTTVTFTATASDGLTTTCSMVVTVVNTQSPVITLNGPNNQTIEACDLYNELGAVAIDNCLGDISADIIIDDSNLDLTTPGTYNITYNVTNIAGVSATEIIRTITVIDTTAPILSLIGPDPLIIGDCSTYTELGAFGDDGCVGDLSANVVANNSSVDTSTLGSYTVTYSLTDNSGNVASTITRTVTVVDVSGPDITLLGSNPQVIEACTPYLEQGATAIDPCFGTDFSSNITVDLSLLDLSTVGVYTIIYNATDALGNLADPIERIIEVVDTTNPEIICPTDIVTSNDIGLCSAIVNYVPPVSIDSCSSMTTIQTAGLASGSTFPLGITTNTFEVTDAHGNTSVCSFTIEIQDNEAPVPTCLADITQNTDLGECGAIVTFGTPSAIDNCSGSVSISQTTGLASGSVFPVGITTNTFSFTDTHGNTNTCSFDVTITDINPVANAGADYINTTCTNTSYTLQGNTPNGSSSGLWTVTSGQTTGFGFSDATDPNAIFTGDIGETYTLNWTINRPGTCTDSSDEMSITFIGCNALDFDGIDDNISFRDNFNFLNPFSIEIWVKPETTSTNVQTIISKRETNNQVDGYDLRLVNNIISFNWNNGQTLSTSPYQLQTNIWHHIAITFDGSNYVLYVDGIAINSVNGALPIVNSVDFLLGAMEETIITPTGQDLYFNGGLDEFRVWNTALTQEQIRLMMNQEIEEGETNVIGSTVPKPIDNLLWNQLIGYYKMNQTTDITNGSLISSLGSPLEGILRFMTTFQPETAPIPYQTLTSGSWEDNTTWLHGNTQQAPNSLGIDGNTSIDWNIVKTQHDINSGNRNITVSSLIIEDETLTISNTNPADGHSLEVSNYLKLVNISSEIELIGESQLLQGTDSTVDYTGDGKIKRDQQGTSNLYNYNYWASPVSLDGNNYRIQDHLYDGNNPVLWTSQHNANPNTTPITLSRRWLYLYENYPENSYADWNAINENTNINVGLGFLMKGSGASAPNQNYTFVGKPNNGTITSPITVGNQALVGNPYPSAIDAQEFIMDNISSTQGTLYFWEHYPTNYSHVLSEYEGGYSAYNMSGGIPAVSPPEISGNGIPTKMPERYIPVSQGFFVVSNATGGNILFENDQRIFVKETVTGAADNGSIFLRQSEDTDNDLVNSDNLIKRIRLNFISPEQATRQILLAFVPNSNVDDNYNYGYDAVNTESFPSDLSWNINGDPYVIQGVGEFNEDSIYPLNLTMGNTGSFEIEIESFENFESNPNVYVYDQVLGLYFQINESNYLMNLESGSYTDRFAIVFSEQNNLNIQSNIKNSLVVNYSNNTQEIIIQNPNNITLYSCQLLNVLGQLVKRWNSNYFEHTSTDTIKIPIDLISQGTYIINLSTEYGLINTKVIIGK